MSAVEARIAAALAEHQPRYGGADSIACSSPDCVGVEWEPAHLASVVAALPDIAIVELNPVYFPLSEVRVRFENAATDIRRGYPPVGLYITAAVLEVLDQIAAHAAEVDQ